MATESQNGRIVSFHKKAAGRNTPFDAEAMKADNTIGKKITEARKRKKISQKDLAKIYEEYNITVSSGAISKWEKGVSHS